MNDQYKVNQAGAVGPNSHAENMTFNQINGSTSEIDLAQLGREMEELRVILSTKANDSAHYVAMGEIASAETSAKTGDQVSALQHLSKAGSWVWETAKKVGIGVATAAALHELGLK